jgi:hypothetical protein
MCHSHLASSLNFQMLATHVVINYEAEFIPGGQILKRYRKQSLIST